MTDEQATPERKPRKQGLNMRKALAGVGLMEGKTLGKALRDAGFSPNTARIPAAAGLNAESCLAEAAKLSPEISPASLVASARKLLRDRIDVALKSPEKEPLSAVAKLSDTVEKWHGAGPVDRSEERSHEQRMLFAAGLLKSLQAKGYGPFAPPGLGAVVDAEVIPAKAEK